MQKHSLIHLLFISTIVLIACFFGLNLDGNLSDLNYILSDSYSYLEAGKHFYLNFEVHPIRPLLYPLIIGLPNLVDASTESTIVFAIVLNLVFWFLSLVFLYKCIYLLTTSKRSSFYGGLFFAVSFGILSMVFHPLSEITFILLSILSIYQLIMYYQSLNFKHLIYFTTFLLTNVLVRPGVIYIAIIVLLVILYQLIKTSGFLKKRNLILLIPIALIAFQFLMMQAQFGKARVSYIDKVTWYLYLGTKIEASNRNINIDEMFAKRFQEFNAVKGWDAKIELATNDQKEKIIHQPGAVILHATSTVFENLTGKSNAVESFKPRGSNPLFQHIKNFFLISSRLFNILFSLSFVFFLIYALVKRKAIRFFYSILLSYLIYSIGISGISFWQGDRFSIVCYPVAILLFFELLNQRKSSQQLAKNK